MVINIDPIEFNEWKKPVRREDDDLLHAFKAIKILEQIKFTITIEPEAEQKMEKIEELVAEWD